MKNLNITTIGVVFTILVIFTFIGLIINASHNDYLAKKEINDVKFQDCVNNNITNSAYIYNGCVAKFK